MHRKKAYFDTLGGQNPCTDFDETIGMVDYVRDPTPHDNFGGGSSTWVVSAHTWLVTSRSLFSLFSFFLFFLSFFAFFATRPGHISWPIGTIYTSKRVFLAKDVPFGGLDNIWPHSGGQSPQKNLPKIGQNRHFTAKSTSMQNGHISVSDEDICVSLERQIEYRGHNPKNAKLGQRGLWGGHMTQFWNYGTPSYLGNGRS